MSRRGVAGGMKVHWPSFWIGFFTPSMIFAAVVALFAMSRFLSGH